MSKGRRNGGLIGSQRRSSNTNATGIWSLSDQQESRGAGNWPVGVPVVFKLWGGAGQGLGTNQCSASPGFGGAGGFLKVSTGTTVPKGSVLYIYVGSGGGNTNVGGGGTGARTGGGASYIYLNGVQGSGTLLAVAGGGGAVGGAGGGTTGQGWGGASSGAGGGTQSAGGVGGTGGFGGAGAGSAGSFLQGGGGSNCSGMGGGGGYYGGGGGSGDCGACPGAGGGGGSSYFNTTYFPTADANETGTLRTFANGTYFSDATVATTAGGSSDPDYVAGIGSGVANGNGGNGLVVVYVGGTKNSFVYTSTSPYYYTFTV